MATTKAAPGKKGLINFDFLQKLGKVVEDMLSDGLICVVGGKQPIEANKELFT